MTVLTRHKSRQFNFSLHVKINYIEFEDKFLIKIKNPRECKRFSIRRLLNEFSNKYNIERLSMKVWNRMHCSKRSAVFVLFLVLPGIVET